MKKEQPEFTFAPLNSLARESRLAISPHVLKDYPLEPPLFWRPAHSDGYYAGIRRTDATMSMGKLVCAIHYDPDTELFTVTKKSRVPLEAPFPTLREALTYAHTSALLGIELEGGGGNGR